MSDWVEALTVSKAAVDKLGALQTSSFVPPSLAKALDPTDLSLLSKLFQDLYAISEQSKGTRVLFNVQLAALHISFMLKGFKESPGADLAVSSIQKRFFRCFTIFLVGSAGPT